MSSSNVLILGGTGFISSYICRRLHQEGFSCVIVTRGVTAGPLPGPNGRVLALHGATGKATGWHTDVIHADRDSKDSFRHALSTYTAKHDITWSMVVDCIAFRPRHVEDVQVALRNRFRLYVLISTDSIYQVCQLTSRPEHGDSRGINDEHGSDTLDARGDATDEDMHALRRRDSYGFDKWRCECLCHLYATTGVFPFVALRLADVVGPHEDKEDSRHWAFQQDILHAAHKGARVYLPCATRNTRLSFVYVEDVAAAVVDCWKNRDSAEVVNHSFNLASTEHTTLTEYVDLVTQAVTRETLGKRYICSKRCPCNNNNNNKAQGSSKSNNSNNNNNNKAQGSSKSNKRTPTDTKASSSHSSVDKEERQQEQKRRPSRARFPLTMHDVMSKHRAWLLTPAKHWQHHHRDSSSGSSDSDSDSSSSSSSDDDSSDGYVKHASKVCDYFPSVTCGRLDNTLARKRLGWRPTPLPQWLAATVLSYQK